MRLSLGADRTSLITQITTPKVFHDLHFTLTHTGLSTYMTALADSQVTTVMIQCRQSEV